MDHANTRYDFYGSAPEITKLYGGRYRIVVRCELQDLDQDWFYDNESQIWKDFGDLYELPLDMDGASDGWEPIDGETYPNQKLIGTQLLFIPQKATPTLEFTYETLTDTYVEESSEKVDTEINGLRRVTRTVIADENSPYTKDVGTETITHSSRTLPTETLYLASAVEQEKRPSENGFTRIQEVWLESGILAESKEYVNAQQAIVYEIIGPNTVSLGGYSLAKQDKSNYKGLQTTQYTYLKNNTVLFQSEEFVDGKRANIQEVFNGGPDGNGKLAKTEESNVNGIPTKRYTYFQSGSNLFKSEDFIDARNPVVSEVFDGTPGGGGILAKTEEINASGIPTRRYTYVKSGAILSKSQDLIDSRQLNTEEVFGGDPSGSGTLVKTEESNVDGVPTRKHTYAETNVTLSRSIREKKSGSANQGAITIEEVETFGGEPTGSGGIKIGEQIINEDGIETKRATFVLSNDKDIRTTTRPGPPQLPGTKYITIESIGQKSTPSGEIVDESVIQEDGYIRYITTAISGTIEGVKQTYPDIVTVDVPGTVACTTVNVSSGGISGTIAVPSVTPARKKRVAANVTIEITASPPSKEQTAFDIGNISCSVTSTNTSLVRGPGATVTTGSGTATVSSTGYVQNFSSSARVQTYPGCYLTASESSGTVSYITSSQPRVNGNTIVTDEASSSRSTSCIGAGASAPEGYTESGIVRRDSRPVLTTLDGTTYYEVITWRV